MSNPMKCTCAVHTWKRFAHAIAAFTGRRNHQRSRTLEIEIQRGETSVNKKYESVYENEQNWSVQFSFSAYSQTMNTWLSTPKLRDFCVPLHTPNSIKKVILKTLIHSWTTHHRTLGTYPANNFTFWEVFGSQIVPKNVSYWGSRQVFLT